MNIRQKNISIQSLARAGLLIAFMTIFAQIHIPLPFTPIPITLQTFGALLIAGLSGPVSAFITSVAYVLLGLVGIPVFSGLNAGLSALAGPTGGFIIGFIPAITVASILLMKKRKLIAVGSFFIILYIFGGLWFAVQTNTSFLSSLLITVVPFIFGDLLKSVLFFYVYPKLIKML